ncbi:MAG: HRDC domain-containing protein, partial [Rickettsiales bacterium]
IPRGRLLKDDTLTNIAASAPKNPKELQRMRGMNKGLDKKLMEALADVIDNARQLPKSAAPALPTPIFIPPTANAAIELLRVLLKRQCDSKGVAQKLVANRSDLDQIAIGNLKDSPVSHGWRWEVFGKYAADLMKGELALALEPEEGAVILLTHEDMEPESA